MSVERSIPWSAQAGHLLAVPLSIGALIVNGGSVSE